MCTYNLILKSCIQILKLFFIVLYLQHKIRNFWDVYQPTIFQLDCKNQAIAFVFI
jgi:hypothetical protein